MINQIKRSEARLRQGFQPLRAFDSWIGLTVAVQRIYIHNMTLPYQNTRNAKVRILVF